MGTNWDELEYNTLRNELIKRVELRQQLMGLNLTIAAAFLGVALKETNATTIALVYPPISAFLVLAWYHHHTRIIQINNYIKDNIEIKFGYTGWVSSTMAWVEKEKGETPSWKQWRLSAISDIGTALFAQLLAIFFGIVSFTETRDIVFFKPPLPFVFIDALSVLAVFWILIIARRWM